LHGESHCSCWIADRAKLSSVFEGFQSPFKLAVSVPKFSNGEFDALLYSNLA
jgi:hypothetical protein